jgi:hypothetical protein
MERFIAEYNILRFKDMLEKAVDRADRSTLETLLLEEEQKLRDIQSRGHQEATRSTERRWTVYPIAGKPAASAASD